MDDVSTNANNSITGGSTIGVNGNISTTIITAECAYL